MKVALLVTLVLTLFGNGCSNLLRDQSTLKIASKEREQPCSPRYVPVGNNPEIALDTESGTLCRTIADTNDPLGIRDAACGVSQQEKKSANYCTSASPQSSGYATDAKSRSSRSVT
jgi:hypothetical protein